LPLRVLPVQIAHSHIAVKFSESENSSLLFLSFKKAMEFLTSCCSHSLGYRYIKAYFSKFVKFFLVLLQTALLYCLGNKYKHLIFMYRLVIQAGHGRQGPKGQIK